MDKPFYSLTPEELVRLGLIREVITTKSARVKTALRLFLRELKDYNASLDEARQFTQIVTDRVEDDLKAGKAGDNEVLRLAAQEFANEYYYATFPGVVASADTATTVDSNLKSLQLLKSR